MKDAPLVSVIMPAYNSAAFIAEAIGSVQLQTYTNWELWVIDDASADQTVWVVESFIKKDPRIKLIRNQVNSGSGVSRNLGIKAASGTYIAFLDSDDLWLKEKLEVQLNFMQKNELAMTFSSYYLIPEEGGEPTQIVNALPVLTYPKLLKSNYVGNLTGIYNTEKIGKIFAPELRKRQDWALWLKILKIQEKTLAIPEPLAIYRVRKEGISGNKTALLKYNFSIYREFLNYNFLKSSVLMSRFLWEHFFVKKKQIKSIK